MTSINRKLAKGRDSPRLSRAYELWWPRLEEQLQTASRDREGRAETRTSILEDIRETTQAYPRGNRSRKKGPWTSALLNKNSPKGLGNSTEAHLLERTMDSYGLPRHVVRLLYGRAKKEALSASERLDTIEPESTARNNDTE